MPLHAVSHQTVNDDSVGDWAQHVAIMLPDNLARLLLLILQQEKVVINESSVISMFKFKCNERQV